MNAANVMSLGAYSYDGRLLFSSKHPPELKALPKRLHERELIAKDRNISVWSGIPYTGYNNTLLIDVAAPVYSQNISCGIVFAVVNANEFKEIVHDGTGLQSTGQLLVAYLTENGNLVNFVIPPVKAPTSTNTTYKGVAFRAAEGQAGFFEGIDFRGVDIIASYRPIYYASWGLAATLDKAEAYSSILKLERILLIALSCILVLGILAAFLLAKYFSHPITDLGDAASKLARGDYTARAHGRQGCLKDEIDELCTVFNYMADQISNSYSTLENKVVERTQELALLNAGLSAEVEERKKIELQLQDAKEQAISADKAKSEFLANMSHEIRAPLNGIINCTELCLDTPLGTEQIEYLELSLYSAKHLLRLIADILDFSKIEAGKMDLENIEFSFEDQMEHAVSVLASRARTKGLVLVSWLKSPNLPEVLLGDPGRLFQIFINLLGNGIKYTDKGEVVLSATLLSLTDQTAEVLFAVKDTGIGIPQAKQSLLFQAFSQVHASDARLYGGTGLGLMISSRLANAMGGHMWVESEAGRGSTFFFNAKFAVPARAAPSSTLVPCSCVCPKSNHLRALVVDKNDSTRKSIVSALERLGAEANDTGDALLALEMLQTAAYEESPYTLLIVDSQIGDGGTNCAWLLHHIKEQDLLRCKNSRCHQSRIQELKEDSRRGAVQGREGSLGRPESPTPDWLFAGEGKESRSEEPDASAGEQQQLVPGVGLEAVRVRTIQDSSRTTHGGLSHALEEDAVLPVVLLTHGSTDDKSLCKSLGVQFHVPKPVKRKLLIQRVKQALKLPLQERLSGTNSTASDEAAAAAIDRSLKILVAEDNIVNQRVALTLLRKWGHEAVLASDGEEAVEKVQEEDFDVILMDVQMPVCDGLQATKRIRDYESTKNRHTPIIAMTAQALIGDGMKCIDAGMDSYMSKPLNASKLKDLLRLVCRPHALPKPTSDSTREF
ncbi:hypothetical protein CLOM_g18512 [Closterium sp. NIES-68]|nr:hypothetical protein CLOM_g18512 [Closterium sp. NIES-68]GJP62547.1 hypothetical protein CLOP_g19603 [Closterium sp. NIES-67]